MELNIRNTEDYDYPILLDWWKFWKFSAPPIDILPNNGLDGVMVSKDGVDLCAGFLYATSSPKLFWIEWIVSNPNVKDRKLRHESKIVLINSLVSLIKNMGGTVVYTSLQDKFLEKYYTECGFITSSRNNIEMIKNV